MKLEKATVLTLTMVSLSSIIIVVFVGWYLLNANQRPQDVAAVAEPSIETQLILKANEFNLTAPEIVGPGVRFDGASAGPGLTFTQRYTTLVFNASQIKSSAFEELVVPDLRKQECESPLMKYFFEKNVQVTNEYRGKDGELIGKILIDRLSCGLQSAASQ